MPTAEGKPIVIIADNASYHKSRVVNALRRKHRDVLRVLYLPPRTPEMAVVEQVIGAAKRAMARRSPKGKRGAWRALRAAAKAGEIPIFKLYDWMVIDDEGAEGGGDGSSGRQGRASWPRYERDVTAITLRRGERAKVPPRKRRRSKRLSAEARRVLVRKHFGRGRVPPRLIAKIPDALLRDIPPGLVRT